MLVYFYPFNLRVSKKWFSKQHPVFNYIFSKKKSNYIHSPFVYIPPSKKKKKNTFDIYTVLTQSSRILRYLIFTWTPFKWIMYIYIQVQLVCIYIYIIFFFDEILCSLELYFGLIQFMFVFLSCYFFFNLIEEIKK